MRYRINDPPWIDQRIENGFWDDKENRLWYLNWLGQHLGFSTPEKWYQVSVKNFEENYGASLLYNYYGNKFNAVSELFPAYEWKMWLFSGGVPNGFWENFSNQRLYMDWLGKKLGYSELDDWYGVTQKDFRANNGSGFLQLIFDSSVSDALLRTYPNHDWKIWKFKTCPNGYWLNNENIYEYLNWLGHKLNYSNPEDWYQISSKILKNNYGTSLLGNIWKGHPNKAAYTLYPDYDWKPWLFNNVPPNWWSEIENRKEYLHWLSQRLGFIKLEDWYGVTIRALKENYGSSLLTLFNTSPSDIIINSFPEHDWKPWLFNKVRSGYWDEWNNRRNCIDWLGEALNLKSPEDWYQVTVEDFKKNNCSGILHYFGNSTTKIVEDAYPEYNWNRKNFRTEKTKLRHLKGGYNFKKKWNDTIKRTEYLKLLGKKLGFIEPEDWYQISLKDFQDNGGTHLINQWYHGSPVEAVKVLFPEFDHKPWLFRQVPKKFWHSESNCRDYMIWLESQLGITNPKDWYRVQNSDFKTNNGGGFLSNACNNSRLKAVQFLYPEYPWKPERFTAGLRTQKRLHTCLKAIYPKNIIKWNYLHPEMKFSSSSSKMELDIFLPELNLGFEYQGEGHFFPLAMWGGEVGLKHRKELDAEKRAACSEKSITLIEVPYWWDGSEAELKQLIESGTQTKEKEN